MIDAVVGATRTPYLALHDLDANKPGASIRIRVKTFDYALRLYKEELVDRAAKRSELERALATKRAELVAAYRAELEQAIREASDQAWQGLEAAFDDYLEGDGAGPDEDGIAPPKTLRGPHPDAALVERALAARDERQSQMDLAAAE